MKEDIDCGVYAGEKVSIKITIPAWRLDDASIVKHFLKEDSGDDAGTGVKNAGI